MQPDHRVIKGSDDITPRTILSSPRTLSQMFVLDFGRNLWLQVPDFLEGFCDQSLLSGLLEVTGEDLDP